MMSVGAVLDHNKSTYASLEPGDMVEFPRGWYSHWGIYIGNGRVVHLTGDHDGVKDGKGRPDKMFTISGRMFDKAFVREDDLWDVADGQKLYKNNKKDEKCTALSVLDIVSRARDKLGVIGYNVLWSNCEHFAAWCRYDVEWSQQVESAFGWAAVGGLVAAAAGMLLAWSRSGEPAQETYERRRQT